MVTREKKSTQISANGTGDEELDKSLLDNKPGVTNIFASFDRLAITLLQFFSKKSQEEGLEMEARIFSERADEIKNELEGKNQNSSE